MARLVKRESDQIDKLVAKVEELNKKGMSVNKACKQVGLQPTVFYFRRRREEAENKQNTGAEIRNVPKASFSNKDVNSLMQEYRELETRLNSIKLEIAEKVMSQSISKSE